MPRNIIIVAGPCAIESEKKIMDTAYKISLIRDVARPYGIDFKLRGGAWKPRTRYLVQNGNIEERVFEGIGEIGLQWLAQAAKEYNLPVVSELMSEMDLRYFHRHLNPKRDYIQIGARNSQNFALLFHAGVTDFGILLKNLQHGIDPNEVKGSIERLIKNREIVYCTRGQKRFIHPNGEGTPEYNKYMTKLLKNPIQHPDSRNLNNISAINRLRDNQGFNKIKFCHDPSHIWGGKTHQMRRKIGEYAIKAITEYNYDWVMVEVCDKSKDKRCDKEQALLTTLNGIDWSQTYVGQEPPKEQTPITLVDIVVGIMKHQVNAEKVSGKHLEEDRRSLYSI